MRIVILTVDHMYANKVVKDVLAKYPEQVKLIIESDSLLHNKSMLKSLGKYLSVSGLHYVVAQAIKLEVYKTLRFFFEKFNLGSEKSKFSHFEKQAHKLKIPVKKVFNVNSKEGKKLLMKARPDLIISVLFNQILNSDVIKIPRKGVINLHPAYLPEYKGISPVFWALANSEKEVGVSVHYINQGIDTGGILGRKKFRVSREDTEDSLYWKLVKIGSLLLISVINKLAKTGKLKTINNAKGGYFSLPTQEAVDRYLKKRKTFFRLKDLFFQS